jgi:tRNA G18 (ribose-2'-O)-methylase SpoU
VQQICAQASRVAVLDNITDAANVGGIFRSAAALGVDAVLVMRSCCDPLCRKAVRVSMGTVFQIPWTYIENGIAPLQELGFKTAALALREQAVSIDDPKLMAEARLALIFGTEGYGLAQATIDACDYVVQIPMAHDVDSLNVAAASAVTFWQLRHR